MPSSYVMDRHLEKLKFLDERRRPRLVLRLSLFWTGVQKATHNFSQVTSYYRAELVESEFIDVDILTFENQFEFIFNRFCWNACKAYEVIKEVVPGVSFGFLAADFAQFLSALYEE
jgi:hypothetical protein